MGRKEREGVHRYESVFRSSDQQFKGVTAGPSHVVAPEGMLVELVEAVSEGRPLGDLELGVVQLRVAEPLCFARSADELMREPDLHAGRERVNVCRVNSEGRDRTKGHEMVNCALTSF